MWKITKIFILFSVIFLSACESSSNTQNNSDRNQTSSNVSENNNLEVVDEDKEIVTATEIQELVDSGEINELKTLISNNEIDSTINIDVIKSYIDFLESNEPMSLRTAKLMDNVSYPYYGILATEIENAIYFPHEEGSVITGVFEGRTGFDKIDWKNNSEKDAYKKAKHFSDLSIQIESEKAMKAKLIEEAKGKNPHIGMSKEEVEASLWGKPQKINRTVTQFSIHEQWVYGNGQYLYFTDGFLTSFQD